MGPKVASLVLKLNKVRVIASKDIPTAAFPKLQAGSETKELLDLDAKANKKLRDFFVSKTASWF